MRVISVLLVTAGLAVAQEISSNDGALNVETENGMTVSRRQEISIFALSTQMSATVSNVESTLAQQQADQTSNMQAVAGGTAADISSLRETISILNGDESPIALGVRAIANEMQTNTNDLLVGTTANTARLNAMQAVVSAAQAAMAQQGAALTASVSSSIGTMETTIDARIGAVMQNLSATGAELTRSQSAGAAALQSSVAADIRRVNASLATVTGALANKRDERLHMWTGSCSNNGDGGWREYCFNRVDVDTAMPYFRKASDARLRTVRAGYFTVNFFRLFQSCNWEYTLLYFGGTQRRHTHHWTGGNSQWRDQEVEMTWGMGANQEFWARAWTCNWSIWNTDRSQTRFTAIYAGALAP